MIFRAGAVLLLALSAALPGTARAAEPSPRLVQGESAPLQGPPAPTAQVPGQAELPPLVSAILVEGEQRYSEAQLISALGQKVGKRLDAEVIDRGLRTLWTSFHVRGDVMLNDVPASALMPAASVELVLIVVEMPSDREPRFIGHNKIDVKTLKRWALIEERVELFEYQVSRVRQRLLEGYRREGFFWVEIDIVQRTAESADKDVVGPMNDVIFEIREGPKVRVKAIEVSGNQSMPERGIMLWKDGLTKYAEPQLSAPSIFNWFGSPFVQETLDADLLAMSNVYRARGWLDVVVEADRLEWSDDRSEVRIHIVIDEGKPYTVSELKVEFFEYVPDAQGKEVLQRVEPGEGRTHFSSEELLAKCKLKSGARFEEGLQVADRAIMREMYGQEGYLSHDSLPKAMRCEFPEPELFFNPQEHKLQVTYRIVEGRPLTLREIAFAGNYHTRDEVLRREVSLFPGDRADQKEINKSLARIQSTGYFSDRNPGADHREPTYRYIAVPGSRDLVDLEFEVEEGHVIEFNISGGIDSNDGLFGLIVLSMNNFDITDTPTKWSRTLTEVFRKEAFHGAGQKIDIEVSPGTQVNRARFHFREPDIFNRYLEPISLDLDFRRQLRNYQGEYDEDRADESVALERRFGFDYSASIGLVHSDIETSDLDSSGVPVALQVQHALGTAELAGLTANFTWRALDNYANPHNGHKMVLRNILYTDALSTDYEYLRSDLQFDGYMATGQRANGTEHVLHLELDGGIMPSYGSTDEVPYTELFYIGGSNSLRGFEYRGAGARGDDVLGAPTQYAAGGESYLAGSLEWLYPLYSITQPGTYRQVESLRGVLFLDWAVLGADPFNIDLNEARASVGFGVGLAYPLPIQLNFGFPIRIYSGDQRQTFSFGIGLTF